MRLADLSTRLRREQIAFALKVALQDLKEPARTIEVARMIGVRLETAELDLVGRTIVSMAPAIPQAQQSSKTFKRYGRDMRSWVWSPIAAARLSEADTLAVQRDRDMLAMGETRDADGEWPAAATEAWHASRKR